MKSDFYVDLLLAEWGLEKYSPRIKSCTRTVLRELAISTQLFLRNEPKLQFVVVPEEDCGMWAHNVWAYFPIHKNRRIVRTLSSSGVKVKPTTRVLLVIGEKDVKEQPIKLTKVNLRDHLGHVLLYLRSPKARNECVDAGREWEQSCA